MNDAKIIGGHMLYRTFRGERRLKDEIASMSQQLYDHHNGRNRLEHQAIEDYESDIKILSEFLNR